MRSICPYCKAVYDDLPKEYLHKVVACSSCGKEFVCKDANKVKKTVKKSNVDVGMIVRWIFLLIIFSFIGWLIWYNLPSKRQARKEKQEKLNLIQSTYMTNDGETACFHEEVARLNDKYIYENIPVNKTTKKKCADSVREILNHWNSAVSGFKNAEQKQFTSDEIEVLAQICGEGYGNAYLISSDFELPKRIALIQKSQAQAVQVGEKIYKVVKKTAPEQISQVSKKEKKLVEEYENLINEGNLTPKFKQAMIRDIFGRLIKLHYGDEVTVEEILKSVRELQRSIELRRAERELAESEERYICTLNDNFNKFYYGKEYSSFDKLLEAAGYSRSEITYSKLCEILAEANENLEEKSKELKELVTYVERFNTKGSILKMGENKFYNRDQQLVSVREFIGKYITPVQKKIQELRDMTISAESNVTCDDIAFYMRLKEYKHLVFRFKRVSDGIMSIRKKYDQSSAELEKTEKYKKQEEVKWRNVSSDFRNTMLAYYETRISMLRKDLEEYRKSLREYEREFDEMKETHPWLVVGDDYQDFYDKSNQAKVHTF